MSPYWLEIAYQHLIATESAHVDLMAAKAAKDDEQIATALQKEFVSGMQAITALGLMGTIRFCDTLSRWAPQPNAENRMSCGVGKVTGAIPSTPDQIDCLY
jgi:hypothetical protein